MDILWAISNPPPAPPGPPKPPRLAHRSSTSFGSVQYDDLLPSSPTASSLMGMSGAQLLAAATSQNFAVPTPPFADGSWEMYQDFVGGLQFWGYALASGSGDGGVRMWDSECGVRSVTGTWGSIGVHHSLGDVWDGCADEPAQCVPVRPIEHCSGTPRR